MKISATTTPVQANRTEDTSTIRAMGHLIDGKMLSVKAGTRFEILLPADEKNHIGWMLSEDTPEGLFSEISFASGPEFGGKQAGKSMTAKLQVADDIETGLFEVELVQTSVEPTTRKLQTVKFTIDVWLPRDEDAV